MTNITVCEKCGRKIHTKDPNRPRTSDGRNIIDKYFGWTNEDINKDLKGKSNNFSVVICNTEMNINIGTIIRSANAFGARNVVLYGSKRFDRRGTCGAHHYCNMIYCKNIDDFKYILSRDAFIIGAENNIISDIYLNEFTWPIHSHIYIIFGHETNGIPTELLNICNKKITIRQSGATRSLNVAVAASIFMYDFLSKMTIFDNK